MANTKRGSGCGKVAPPLRTSSSQFQCVIRDILYNFFKFSVHRKLQGQVGYRSAIANTSEKRGTGFRVPVGYSIAPLRTSSSPFQCVIRNILYYDYFKFNVYIDSKVEYPRPSVCGLAVRNG